MLSPRKLLITAPYRLIIVAVKIILGQYVKSAGKKVDSDSLVNSGQDALLDSIISASTLAAAGIYIGFGLSLEAYLWAVISAVIIKSGIDIGRHIREANDKVNILFCSTSNDYAMQSYELNASYYMTKPLSEDAVTSMLKRINLKRMNKTQKNQRRSKFRLNIKTYMVVNENIVHRHVCFYIP